MNKSDIIEITKANNIYPNKSLGQSFLFNPSIIDKIIIASEISKDDKILEIGPGLGALTKELLSAAGSVTAVEIDSGLVRILRQELGEYDNIRIVHADFLKIDLQDQFTKVVSNLPYSSASEILFCIAEKYKIKELYIMLQKEMAERIVSIPGSKSYGALTVTLGLYYDPRILFNIDSKSFYPEPDVISSFIKLIYNEDNDLSKEEVVLFHKVVRSVFWGRRKRLLKVLSVSPHLKLPLNLLNEIFYKINIDKNIRGENLDVQDFKYLVKNINVAIKEECITL